MKVNMDSVQDQVVLLSGAGEPIGTHSRLTVHGSDTQLHLAFSSYLFGSDGRLLVTRRALNKLTWPGVWTNSCCGHPRPDEDLVTAIKRRVFEELDVIPTNLRCLLPEFRYRAVDSSGIVENEICPVWAGTIDADGLRPDPAEIVQFDWLTWTDYVTAVKAFPAGFSPWAAAQVADLGGTHPLRRGGDQARKSTITGTAG